MFKICTRCNSKKELTHFSNKKNGKFGKRSACKECTNKLRKENKELINENNKIYYNKNKSKILENKKIYYKENEKTISDKRRVYERNRYHSDKLFRLSKNIRNLIWKSLSRKGFEKSNKVSDIIGCTYIELIEHLNDNNYGFEYSSPNIDIDHIIPLSTATNKDEIIKLNHYTNLQLLPSEYNKHIKSDKEWNIEDFEEWLSQNIID